jgi:hypothetical protein
MSDNPATTMLAKLQARRGERERQGREGLLATKFRPGEEILENKLERFLLRPDSNVELLTSNGEELLAEFEVAYLHSGGRDVPVEVRDAIRAKVENVRFACTQLPRARNRGGNPGKYDWDAFWIEIVRYALDEGSFPGERRNLRQHMIKWCKQNWTERPVHLDEEIKKRVDKLYDTSGIIDLG